MKEERIIIRGGKRLVGEISISGAKNAAVGVIPAVVLCDEPCVIENLPNIKDVLLLREIMQKLGAKAEFSEDGTMKLDASGIKTYQATDRLVGKMRASYYLLGSLLGRFGQGEVVLPGGCEIGLRPIDQHIKGFQALGAEVWVEGGMLKARCDALVGAEIYLDMASVGATINIMLAAVRARGQTVIVNAAKEPHVVDVANFLNCMGASVKGAGTDVIRIRGVEKLRGCSYAIIPDQIEAGTIMIAAAGTKGDVVVHNV
ncbi:MAG: UDP-N-acetylglucosamine 1-carboxyvinyltransferase, partial [Christensenellales bacterium]